MTFAAHSRRRRPAAYSLPELLVCIAVMMFVYGGSIMCYMMVCQHATWSAYSLAGAGLSVRQLEEARAAKYDMSDSPPVDEITNIPTFNTNILDLPYSGTNRSYATNFCTVSTIYMSNALNSQLHLIKVDCVWTLRGRTFTNTIQTYRSPN